MYVERPDLFLTMGSHRVESSAGAVHGKVAKLRNIALGHIPVRSASQLLEKIRRGIAVLDQDYSQTPLGYHWRIIDRLIERQVLSFPLLQKIAYHYQFKDDQPEVDIPSALVHDRSQPAIACAIPDRMRID